MASLPLTITISSVASTSITLTPAAPFTGSGGAFTAAGPIAAGVTVGTISVAPTGWQGAISLSGANVSSFTLSGMTLVTTGPLAAGTYAVTINTLP